MRFQRAAAPALEVQVGDQYGTIPVTQAELKDARRDRNSRKKKYPVSFENGTVRQVQVRYIIYSGSQMARKHARATTRATKDHAWRAPRNT